MRRLSTLQVAILLSLSASSMAATVDYQHPDLTIVAKDEPLQSVLRSVGKEMRIYITVPTGLNPVVNCDIQQPVKQAFKTLLREMSYSLEWEEETGQVVGLTILAGSEGAATASNKPSHTRRVGQAAPVTAASEGNQGAAPSVAQSAHETTSLAADDTARAEHEAQMETERAAMEARMAEEREAREAEMALRHQEEELAHEARMAEEVARHEAEMQAELESEGLEIPQ